MWPHKSGLGIQLSYGVDGNGIFVRQKATDSENTNNGNPGPNLSFPRIQTDSKILYRSHHTSKLLVPAQTSTFDLNSKVYKDLENVYVPEEILKSYMIESKSLTSAIVFDPTVGSLFEFHDARMKKGKRYGKVLAYVTGDTGTILNISAVMEEEGTSHKLPKLSTPYQVSLSEPIKQIHFSKLQETFDFIPSYLLIRTDSNIYILNVLRTTSGIELTLIDEINTHKLNGPAFADVCFNPWDFTQFAVIDIKGNFGIWNISTNISHVNKLSLHFKDTETIPDVAELSNWKRITWAHNHENILIATRSSLTQIHLTPSSTNTTPEVSLTRIITSSWSKILDFKRANKYSFLLTSKELIWLSLVNETPTRIISWKHFLDEKDPSLKLEITQTNKNPEFMCTIYSQSRLLLFIYTFGLRDSVPFSMHDPYYIRTTTGLMKVEVCKLNREFYHPLDDVEYDTEEEKEDTDISKSFGLFELKTDLQLSIDILTHSPNIGNATASVNSSTSNSSNPSSKESTPAQETKRNSRRSFKKLLKSEIEDLSAKIKDKKNNIPIDTSTIQMVQDYAFKLGNGIEAFKSNPSSFLSLTDISKDIPQMIDEVSEFDTMIDQLSSYYKENDISTINFLKTPILQGKIGDDNNALKISNVNDLTNSMTATYFQGELKKFNDENDIKQASMLLGSSLIRAKSIPSTSKKSDMDSLLQEELKVAPSKIQNILSNWGNEGSTVNEEINDNFRTSQMTVPDIVTSSMPTLRLSSQLEPPSQRLKRKKSTNSRISQLSQLSQSRIHTPSKHRSTKTQIPSQLSQTSRQFLGMELTSPMASSQGASQLSPPIQTQTQTQSQSYSQSQSQSQSSQIRFSQGSQRLFKKKKKKGGFA